MASDSAAATPHGTELWTSDGTDAGTVMVADVNSGSANSSPTSLTVVNNHLFFSATDGTNGQELWVSDGVVGGDTHMVKDTHRGTK